MKISRIVLIIGLVAVALGLGIAIGRAQLDGALGPGADEVDDRLAAILEMPEPRERTRALAAFFSTLVPIHLEVVREVYAQHRFDVDAVAKVMFADWWARFDPAAALQGRIRPTWEAGDDPWVDAVVGRWVRDDPQSALAAVQQLGHQPLMVQHEAYRALIDGWFEHADADPTVILRLLDHISLVEVRSELYSAWAYRMVEARGAESALELVASLPEDDPSMRVKREMMGRVAGVVATRDPEAAIAFATRNADTEAGSKLAYYLVSDWSRRDGPAAIEWATTLRSPTAHKVVERGWRNFLAEDPDAAIAWMEKQTHSRFLEPAYALYLQQLAKSDHQHALEKSDAIEDDQRRVQVYQAIGRAWLGRDPEGAMEWLARVKLSPEIRKRILAVATQPVAEPAGHPAAGLGGIER